MKAHLTQEICQLMSNHLSPEQNQIPHYLSRFMRHGIVCPLQVWKTFSTSWGKLPMLDSKRSIKECL